MISPSVSFSILKCSIERARHPHSIHKSLKPALSDFATELHWLCVVMHIDFPCSKTVGESNRGYSYSLPGEILEQGADILSQICNQCTVRGSFVCFIS